MPTAVAIVVTALVTAVGGYLMNQLPEVRQFKGRNWLIIRLFVWITLVPVAYELLTNEGVSALFKTIAQYGLAPLALLLVLDGWKLISVVRGTAGKDAAPQDLRTRLLKAVQTEVAERLEDSLNQQVVLNLLMQQQLSQVNRADKQKRISLEDIEKKQAESSLILLPEKSLRRNGTSTQLDPQESIFDTFNRRDVGQKLLILGAPGAGKTTTLLKLAEALVEEALRPEQTLIPIIFELSTWKDDKQSIHDWLMEQLKLNYNIDPKTGANWLKSGHLLPLLDGLDELGLKRQATCVEKINEFIRGLAYPHVVVCCRREEYAEGQVRLGALKGAVCLESLSDDQICRYFCEQLEQPEIWQAMQQQPGLQRLLEPSKNRQVGILRIPLFLTILSVAYGPETPIETDTQLFDAYIHKRLALDTRSAEREQFKRLWAYKSATKEPDEAQTRQYLSWLAKTLTSENLVELLIERLQPRWLENKRQKWAYRRYLV
ncbi:MAG: NACHT domain-containing protein [Cyanobacteria bacterium P01_H01_bin.26]